MSAVRITLLPQKNGSEIDRYIKEKREFQNYFQNKRSRFYLASEKLFFYDCANFLLQLQFNPLTFKLI